MEGYLLQQLTKESKKRGYISEEFIKRLSKKSDIPVSKIFGVASFYSLLHTEPQGRNIIHVCTSPSCNVNGSMNILRFLAKELKIKPGKTSKNKSFSLYETSCIGCCNKPPAMLLNGKPHTDLTKEKIKQILKKCRSSKKQN